MAPAVQGYAFCEFQDESTVDVIIKNLNQRRVGNKALTVKRALEGSKQGSSGGGAPPGSSSPTNPITPAGVAMAKLGAGTPMTASPGQGNSGGGAHGHNNDSPSALQGAPWRGRSASWVGGWLRPPRAVCRVRARHTAAWCACTYTIIMTEGSLCQANGMPRLQPFALS